MIESPYDILGVAEDADDAVIAAAYRRAAKAAHPDQGGSTEAFQLVKEAYDTLCNPGRRAAWHTDDKFDDEEDPDGLVVWQAAVILVSQVILEAEQRGHDLRRHGFPYAIRIKLGMARRNIEEPIAGLRERLASLAVFEERVRMKAVKEKNAHAGLRADPETMMPRIIQSLRAALETPLRKLEKELGQQERIEAFFRLMDYDIEVDPTPAGREALRRPIERLRYDHLSK